MADDVDSVSNRRRLWSANRSSSIDLTPLYLGKVAPVGAKDAYYPFVGQPGLMKYMEPALESYATTIGGSSLATLKVYLNSFFVFLTRRFPDGHAKISDLTSNFIQEHAFELRSCSLKTRVNFHSIGNQVLSHLHARSSEVFPNLSKDGSPLRYPSIKTGNGPGRLRNAPMDLERFLKKYCLQVLEKVDNNKFRNVTPIFGTDVLNPSHVLHHYLQYSKKKLLGEVETSWRHLSAREYPWKSTPIVTANTKLAKQLDRRVGELWCGGSTLEMREALFPTPNEIIASIFLVTIDIGWVDTAKTFVIDGDWYTTLAKDRGRITTREYVALTPQIRPKTGGEVWSKASQSREGGSWWAIKRIEERRKRLAAICRECAAYASNKLERIDESSISWEGHRIIVNRWLEFSRLAFIYFSDRGVGSAGSLANQLYKVFLQNIPEYADFDIPEDLGNAFRKVTHYDFRHLAAERTLRDSGFIATQEFLGHANAGTTLSYLESRKIREDLYEIYQKVAGIAFDEIEQKAILNRQIIQTRYVRNGDQLSIDERRLLGGMTLHGARCKDATSPPFEAGSLSDIRCLGGSCIRCPLAIWNWYDDLAIPMAVNEYARLTAESLAEDPVARDADVAAWEALFVEIPRDLRPRLESELKKACVQITGVIR